MSELDDELDALEDELEKLDDTKILFDEVTTLVINPEAPKKKRGRPPKKVEPEITEPEIIEAKITDPDIIAPSSPEPIKKEGNPVLPKGYEYFIAEKIKTFPATRCYGCNKVLFPANIMPEFFIASQTGGIAPFKCPDDQRVSWVHSTF